MCSVPWRHGRPVVLALLLVVAGTGCQRKQGDACVSSGECPEPLVCFEGACSGPATEGEKCGPERSCIDGLLCLDSACSEPRAEASTCSRTEECNAGLVCHKGVCFKKRVAGEPCDDDADCEVGTACSLGHCSAPKEPGGVCARVSECRDGLKCLAGECFKQREPGEPCGSDEHCVNGHKCYSGVCFAPYPEGQNCEKDGQCQTGLACVRSLCHRRRSVGEGCSYDEHCQPGLSCYESVCFQRRDEGDACAAKAQCATGFDCREGRCFRPRTRGESCASMDDCAAPYWCLKSVCSEPDGQLERMRLVWNAWVDTKRVDCWGMSNAGLLSHDACTDIQYAIDNGRTTPAGRRAMEGFLRAKGITRVRGFIVALVGANIYEAAYLSRDYDWGIELPTHKHFLLKLVLTEFYTTGAFRLWLEKMPSEGVTTKSGQFQFWDSYRESLVGSAYQAVRDAPAGDDTSYAAKQFIEAVILFGFVQRAAEVGTDMQPGY